MKSRERFAITLKINNVTHSHVWDALEPLELGYRVPWHVMRTSSGKVRLVHKNGTEFDVPEGLFGGDQELELKEPSNQSGIPILLRMKRYLAPTPAFARDQQAGAGKGEYFAFASQGQWIVSTDRIGDLYVGKRGGRTIFELAKQGSQYAILLKTSDAKIQSDSAAGITPQGERVVVSREALAKLTVAHEGLSWHFAELDATASTVTTQDILSRPSEDPETRRFQRTLNRSILALLLLLLLVWLGRLLFKPEEEPKPEVQVARIVLPKRLKMSQASAAPAGGGVDQPDNKTDVGAKTLPEPTPTKQVVKTPEKATKPATAQVAAKPRQSQAIEQAKRLENSFGSLLKAAPSSILGSTGGLKANSGRKASTDVWGSRTGPAPGEAIGALARGQEDVRVSYTGAGPGNGGGGAGNGGYGAGVGLGPGGAGGKGGSFVSIANTSAEEPALEDDSGLTRREVWEVINRHASEVRNCYERSMIRRPDVEGRLVVAFTVGRDGRVVQQAVKSSNLQDAQLGQCVLGRLVTWQFPRPRGGVDVKVGYPFVFKRL